MRTSLQLGLTGRASGRRPATQGVFGILRIAWVAIALTMLLGCGRGSPPATVKGTLRLKNGEPLDNCLVTFLPESEEENEAGLSSGLTDEQGSYRLHRDDQKEGAATGWHRVTVHDLSVSTGVRRRDHGTVDAEIEDAPPPPVRPSRVPERYASLAGTPLRVEVKPGDQVIDLEIE